MKPNPAYAWSTRKVNEATPEYLAMVKKCQWWEDHFVMLNGLSKKSSPKSCVSAQKMKGIFTYFGVIIQSMICKSSS